MNFSIKKKGKYKYIEEGEGDVVVLLHGLFGSTGNFTALIEALSLSYKVLVPILPIFDLPPGELSIISLSDHVLDFICNETSEPVHITGNSLGGHLGMMLTLKNPSIVKSLTLTGSSGLFENALGTGYPRRQDYDFITKVCENIFYDTHIATKELVDEVFETVNTPEKGLNIIITAKSAMRHNLEHELHKIATPTLLIWGKEDKITPAFVGEEFHKKIKNSELHIFEKCGHAPMMELPDKFIPILEKFLLKNK